MDNRINKERKFWDGFAAKYDQFTTKNADEAYRLLLRWFTEDTLNSEKLLEIATGTAIISMVLSKHVPSITATDLSPEMLKIARSKAENQSVKNIEFKVEDVCNLSFSADSFDTVIASNVLHLLFEPARAMQEITRVLKPDGSIIVPTYCHGETLVSHFFSRCMNIMGFRARSRWSVKSFQKFIQERGFEIIRNQKIKGLIPMVYLVAKPKANS